MYIKKIFLILIVLVSYSTSVVAVEKFKFKYNLHENLPKKWVTEFKKYNEYCSRSYAYK